MKKSQGGHHAMPPLEVTSDQQQAVEAMAKAMAPHAVERGVEHCLQTALEALGFSPVVGQTVGTRQADLYIPERQCIIEVKATGKVGPKKRRKATKQSTRSQEPEASDEVTETEEQREQLNDYVAGFADDKEKREGPSTHSWWGVLTDGQTGVVYRYDHRGRNPVEVKNATWPLFDHGPDAVIDKLLTYPLAQVTGKPWAGPDLYATAFAPWDGATRELFDAALTKLPTEVFLRDIDTKFQLWLDQMNATGLAPQDITQQRDLFCRHTFLVAATKCVIAAMQQLGRPTKSNQYHGIGSGFTSWITTDWGTGELTGHHLVRQIWQASDRYDWHMRQSDVLRNLYQDCIPKAARKLYGEYYTPDWLAEMLAEEILDPEWQLRTCKIALEALRTNNHDILDGIGVLDPTCGSGTFLYHAARILANSSYWRQISASRQEIADSVALVVLGIDIHPVAVEMARATVMRALPAIPTVTLRIAQGDSLLIDRGQGSFDFGTVVKESPSGAPIHIPQEFIQHSQTPSLIETLVEAANRGRKFPSKMLPETLCTDAMKLLYDDLKAAYKEHGNSVWSWWLRNLLHPHQVAKRKVDRLLANPPWVTINHIRNKGRKKQMQDHAQTLHIKPKGKLAPKFDIAALFAVQCSKVYATDDSREAWLTNDAAVRSNTWEPARKSLMKRPLYTWTFKEVRRQPFHGARCVALIRDVGKPRRHHFEWQNVDDSTVERTTAWPLARNLLRKQRAKLNQFTVSQSAYDLTKTWRRGANLQPYVLVKIASKQPHTSDTVNVTTEESRQPPWNDVPAQSGVIPKAWITPAMSTRSLHPFCCRAQLDEYIIPPTLDAVKRNAYWKRVEKLFAIHRGTGENTANTLFANLDERGKLSQMRCRVASGHTVMYNSAGGWIKSAITPNVVGNVGVCYATTNHLAEAQYLATVLNSDCLQEALQAARESDRDFVLHIWSKIPIPRFDPRSSLHQSIAKFYRQASTAAQATLNADFGPIKQDKAVRHLLRENGIAADIDKLVRQLLPKHTT